MRLIQHIPNFVVGFEPEEDDVDSWEEAHRLPWILRHESNEHFCQWSVARDESRMLMLEQKTGKFWVVAYIKDGDFPELPSWRHP